MGFPRLGAQVPHRGNVLTRALGRLLMRMMRWRFVGAFPDLPKFVLVAAPHTSNWDFVIGMAVFLATGIRVSWMGKHTLFRFPLGGLMRWMGGIPVDRRATHGVVDQMVAELKRRDRLVVGITPEGTRSRAERWKTGFHAMASRAGVPIVLGFIDYDRRCCGPGLVLQPGDDIETDFDRIREFYAGVTARHPENFAVPTAGSRQPRSR